MGRRRDPEKVELERSDYQQAYQEVRKKLREELGGPIIIEAETFDALVRPLRTAARKANLKLLKGAILRKNNRTVCRILFFPEIIEIWPFDDPDKSRYCFYDLIAAQAEYNKADCTYELRELELIDDDFLASELYQTYQKACGEDSDFNISEREFEALICEYAKEAQAIGLAKIPEYMGSAFPFINQTKRGKIDTEAMRNFTQDPYYGELFRNSFDDRKFLFPDIFSPIESLFFSATLFSLCKHLFSVCDIRDLDYNFALEVIVGDGEFPVGARCTWSPQGRKFGEDTENLFKSFWALNSYARLYCDYRTKKYGKDFLSKKTLKKLENRELQKFRNKWTDYVCSAFWQHLGFPLVYSDYHKAGWMGALEFYEGEPLSLAPKRLEEISKAKYLPIVFPSVAPQHYHPSKNCLTIQWALSETDDIERIQQILGGDERYYFYLHEQIKAIYFKFMQLLTETSCDDIVKSLTRMYTKALSDVAMRPNEPTMDEMHKACLLGALHFAREVFAENESGKRANNYLLGHIEKVRLILGRVATAKDFAVFVKVMLAKKDTVVFYWDEKGIYLHYKEYWDQFREFCEEQGVLLRYSAGMFRREVLAPQGYIRPQYRSSRPGAQIRYDYRKKNQEGEEAVVLNVSLDILRLAYPKTRNSVSGIALLYRSLGED